MLKHVDVQRFLAMMSKQLDELAVDYEWIPFAFDNESPSFVEVFPADYDIPKLDLGFSQCLPELIVALLLRGLAVVRELLALVPDRHVFILGFVVLVLVNVLLAVGVLC